LSAQINDETDTKLYKSIERLTWRVAD